MRVICAVDFHFNIVRLRPIGASARLFGFEDMDIFDIGLSPVEDDLKSHGGLGLRGSRVLCLEDNSMCLIVGLQQVSFLVVTGNEP